MSTNKQANRLIHEKSPYLLQHAHNPVNWFSWSDEAFQKAKRIDPQIELVIVGQREYTNLHGIEGIQTHGFVPLDHLQSLFNECAIFLMPALNEPWGLVYLEALACKMPVVGLNRNSFPEISNYGKFGYGLDESDSNLLAAILVNALNEPERLKCMGEAGQKWILEIFSWEKTVRRMVDRMSEYL